MPALNNDDNNTSRTAATNSAVRQHNSWNQHLRHPVQSDALAMHRLVAETGVLDLNSTYAYLLLAADFSATSIVADRDGDLCGMITAYHPPERPEVLFVWQVAVAQHCRGTGLAASMLDAIVHRVRDSRHGHPVTVEATVAPSNTSSRALFGSFARRHGVPLTERPHFSSIHLDPDGAHEDEPMLRIGPITKSLHLQ